MQKLNENAVEQVIIDLLKKQDYDYFRGELLASEIVNKV